MLKQNRLQAERGTVSVTIQIPIRKYKVLLALAREGQMESRSFLKASAASWPGKFDCSRSCPHTDLQAFCQKRGYTDCYGALMRFLLSGEEGGGK
jgi:hypothetical protein